MAFQFQLVSSFSFKLVTLNVLVFLLVHNTIPIFAAADDTKFLQEPTVPLLHYLRIMKFSGEYANLYGAQHQNVSLDESSVTLTLDKSSGSGFKSKEAYMYGFFNAAVKLQAGYTAGVLTSFYLSNNQVYDGWHDEIDIEFLGTIPGEPYTLQTNVYGNGSGDGPNVIGREQKFHLWFDPTQDFHNYSILWTSQQILFLVDGIPIRRFPKVESLGVTYPSKPMSVYATIWDASSWATDGGKYKADYTYEPFLSTYTGFQTIGCNVEKDDYCSQVLLDGCLVSPNLNTYQRSAMEYVQSHYMVYDYCQQFHRPECPSQPPP